MLVCVSGDEIRNITAEEAAFEAALKADFCVPGHFLCILQAWQKLLL